MVYLPAHARKQDDLDPDRARDAVASSRRLQFNHALKRLSDRHLAEVCVLDDRCL